MTTTATPAAARPGLIAAGALALIGCGAFLLVFIAVFAWLAAPAVLGAMADAYDDAFPVVRMRGELVAREPDAVIVHLSGEKLAGTECKKVLVYGQSTTPDGRRHAADAERIDRPQSNITHDAGPLDGGVWRVRPVKPGSVSAQVRMIHQCVWRTVTSTVADVPLLPP